MKYRIPFNKPFFIGNELNYIARSVEKGKISGDGYFTHKCQALIQEKFNAERVLLTHSGTAALEMAAILCKIAPGDEIVVPSFTFVSTVNAFYLRGAKPVFVDIRPDTLNLDETRIEDLLTTRTRAIVPVHYAGVPCEMDAIARLAKMKDIVVIEDAALGVGSKYKGKFLGTIGDIGAYSFHETKNIICGEGGAIVINDEKLIERAEIIREKGTNRTQFFRGEVDKYTWVDVGSSYLLSDLLAAFLLAQLENMDRINQRLADIYDGYYHRLTPMADQGKLILPNSPSEYRGGKQLFQIILDDEKTRDRLMNHLRTRGILAVFHYLPLHLSPIGLKMGYRAGDLPVTESISSRLLRLPFYYDIKEEEQLEVVDQIVNFFN